MKLPCYLFLLCISIHNLYSQCSTTSLGFQNPSFEGTPMAHATPSPWSVCNPSPDTQPGIWGVTLPASNGSTYISMIETIGGYVEYVGQQLSSPLMAGTTYEFTIDLASPPLVGFSYNYSGYVELQIWGGTSLCGMNELLWSSGTISNSISWVTKTVSFTPSSTYNYITLVPNLTTTAYGDKNISVDNISTITPVVPTLSTTSTVATCGKADGTASVSVSNGSGSYTYSWNTSPIQTTKTATNLSSGTYIVTVIDGACTLQDTVIVASSSGPTISLSSTDENCGNKNGTAKVVATGGSSPYTYVWSNGASTSSATNLAAGTYSVTVTDNNGCTTSSSITIKDISGPTTTVNSKDASCGVSDGSANIAVAGGMSPFTYLWSNGASTSSATGLAAGSYTVFVTDANGCLAYDTAIVKTKNNLLLSTSSSLEYCGKKDGTASISVSGGSGNYTYTWNTSPVQTTVTATALSAGIYTVTVTDASCSSTASVNVGSSASPILSFTTTNEQCGAKDGAATVKATGGTGTYTYSWNTSPIQTTKTATNLAAGTYTVSVNDGYCTTIDSVVVSSNNSPTLSVSATPSTCNKANGSASVLASGGTAVYTYSWNTSPIQTTSTALGLIAGTYTVTVDDGICSVNATVTVNKDPNALVPVADFSFNNVCFNEPTVFTDSSNSNTTTLSNWNWNFGDGNSANTQSPSHIYSTDGIFIVSLIITNQYGCIDTNIKQVEVYPLPQTSFSVADVCLKNSSTFNNSSTISSGSISSWNWDFGNGNSSLIQSPNHTYSASGNYNVKLIAYSDKGCSDTSYKPIEIYPLPLTNFSSSSVCIGNPTNFTDQSTISSGTLISWSWDFADGNFASSQSPTHSYSSAGNYNVSLSTTSDKGCSADTTLIASVNTNPIANFTFSDICLYDSANFVNSSTISAGNISFYQWSLGDGNLSTAISPIHKYSTAGNYAISLIAISGSNCADTSTQTITVYEIPQAAISTTNVCDQQAANFLDVSNSNGTLITSWLWDFGAGGISSEQNPTLIFPLAGTYNTSLIVTTVNGCSDTASSSIEIYSIPIADYTTNNVCLHEVSSFTNLSYLSSGSMSYSWNFDDGNSSSISSPTHSFAYEGTYNVTLKTTSDKSCADSITQVLTIYPLPVVDFFPDLYKGCIPFDINFTNNSSISSTNIQSYAWDFGDGNTSKQTSPSHSFSQAGVYSISLTATSDKACINDSSLQIEAYALPVANFSYSPNYITIMNPRVEFSDLSLDPTSWNWIFSDGNTSTEQHPSHNFADTGSYQIELWITNQYGCIDSASGQLRIEPEFMLYIPNTFTPNEDGMNDIFNAKGWGIVEMQLSIFDRWGNKIYSITDINQGWDGKINNTYAIEDIYIYQLNVEDVLSKKHYYKGKIHLIR